MGETETVNSSEKPASLVDKVYQRLKQDLFDFQLLPGDRFTETEVGQRLSASRTPVREALMRLEREGYLTMKSRAGWMVRPFDFKLFEDLYDLRVVLETAAVRRLSGRDKLPPALRELADFWQVPALGRSRNGQLVYQADEAFHCSLVSSAGNAEMTRLHQEITERIRIVRRLDFTQGDRITATYDEHARILGLIQNGQTEDACRLLEEHIVRSRATVQTITGRRLEMARALRFEQE